GLTLQNIGRTVLTVLAITGSVHNHALRAIAQETRAEEVAQQQAQKAASLRPYEPTRAERIFLAVTKGDTPNAFYPLFGSIYAGGGLAVGGGYRQYYGDRTSWTAKGLWSIRNYKVAE